MNNKFKRALSSILAFVMVLSCVTVMNVSSVLADDTTYSSCEYWFDTASTITANTYTVSGGTVVLYGDFEAKQNYTCTYNGTAHASYAAKNSSDEYKALDASGNSIGSSSSSIPASGNAYSFTPGADGKVTFYGAIGDSTRSWSLVTKDTSSNVTLATYSNTSADDSTTISVKAGYTYYVYGNSSTGSAAFCGFVYTMAENITISGTVTITDGSSNTLPTTVKFTNNDDSSDVITVDVTADTVGEGNTATSGTFNVTLVSGNTYTITTDNDALMITSGETIAVTTSTTSLAITLEQATTETVKGTIYAPVAAGGSKVTLTFTNSASNAVTTVEGLTLSSTAGSTLSYYGEVDYTVSLLPGTYTVTATDLSGNGYTLSTHSTDSFKVAQNGGDSNYKNILYTAAASAVTSSDIYVSSSYANSTTENYFGTIREAMAAINVSSLDSYTVHLTPDETYQEQVVVAADNVTFTTDSETDATITWYYGFGYDYYSVNPSTGRYDEEYALLKFSMDDPSQSNSKWGATVIVTGDNFYAENIIFENSYNFRVTDAEKADGVTPSTDPYQGSEGPDRTASGFIAEAKASTERAAAICIPGAKAEFYQCSFLSSQDTVVTNNSTGYYYMNDCLIVGETDYICGYGNLVIDNSKLLWKGYTSSSVGYITAAQGNYLLRNCTVGNYTESYMVNSTANYDSLQWTAGYYGRPWASTQQTIFVNTNADSGSETTYIDTATTTETTDSDGNKYYSVYKGWGGSLIKATPTNVYTVTATLDLKNAATKGSAWTIGTQYMAGDTTTALTGSSITGSTFLSSWVPTTYTSDLNSANYDIYDDGYTTYVFDFTTASSNVSGTASYASSSESEAEGSVTLDASNGNINVNSSDTSYGLNFKENSAIEFVLGSDSGAETADVTITLTKTANDASVKVYNTDDTETAVASVDSSASTITFTGTVGKTYKLVFGSGSVYISKMVITTNGTVSAEEDSSTDYEFDFTAASGVSTLSGTTYDLSGTNDGVVTLDASSGNVQYSDTTNGIRFNSGSAISFVLSANDNVTAGDTADVTVTFTSIANAATVEVYEDSDSTAKVSSYIYGSSGATLNFTGTVGKTYTIKFSDYTYGNDTYTSVYCPSMTITTAAGVSAVSSESVVTNTYEFNLTSDIGTYQNSGTQTYDLTSSSATSTDESVTLDAGVVTLDTSLDTNAKFAYNSSGCYQINKGSAIKFTLVGDGTLSNTVTIKYVNNSDVTDGTTIVITNSAGKTVATSEDITTSTKTDVELTFDGSAGDYTITFNPTKIYSTGVTIATTGTVAGAEEESTSAFIYDSVVQTSDCIYVIGRILASDVDDYSAVGFGISATEANATSDTTLSTSTVFTSIATIGGTEFNSDSSYYYAVFALTGTVSNYSNQKFYVSAFSKANDSDTAVYDAVETCTITSSEE